MMKKMVKLSLMSYLFVGLSLFMLYSSSWGAEKKTLTLRGGGIGSTPYVICGITAEVLKKAFPDALVNVEPGGGVSNTKAVEKGLCDIGIMSSVTIYDAWHGNPPFGKPHSKLRILTALMPWRFQFFARKNTDIKKVEDLLGKNYCPSLPGQSSYEISKKMLAVHGITFEDIEKSGGKVRPMAWGELLINMSDRHIDASSWNTSMPATYIMQILKATDGYLIGFSEEKIEEFLRKYPQFSKAVIPAGSYDGQVKKDINTFGSVLVYSVSTDIPEEVVYKMAKTLWENRDYLTKGYRSLRYMAKDTVIKDVRLPVHPGALKFYKEIGVPEAR